jgi:hypothetical protein
MSDVMMTVYYPGEFIISIVITYYIIRNSDYIMKRVGQGEFRRLTVYALVAHCNCCAVSIGNFHPASPDTRRINRMDWDLTSVGLVLIGSSITAAGTIIAALLMGITVTLAPFLLLTTAVLIVMSAILIVYKTPRSPPPI